MDLVAIRTQLANQLDAVSGLRASPVALDSPTPPIAIVYPATGGPFLTVDVFGDQPTTLALTVTVLVAKATDRGGQNTLDAFLATTSIWAAITDQTLGGTASYAKFTEARNYGLLEWAAVQYYGFELGVEVGVT